MTKLSSAAHQVLLLVPLSAILLLVSPPLATAQPPSAPFQCTTTSTCMAQVGYISPNTTTLSHIQSMFQVKTLNSILGANKLPDSTPRNHTVRANTTVTIPIPCRCFNGVGMSNHVPKYTVVKDDGLSHIATQVFGGLVEYPKIAAANNIKDVNLIHVGDRLWIPLPCSCNDVDGQQVVHYAHVAASGSSVGQIAAEFGTTSETLMRLNNMTDPKSLLAGQVLDVPITACSSSVSNKSSDFQYMRIANGTYVYTANNCVKCTCTPANNFTLQCEPSGLTAMNWKKCPAMECPDSNLSLGNSTTESNCRSSTCAYAGYDSDRILTTLATHNTCPESSDGAPEIHRRSWSLAVVLVCLQAIVLLRFL